LHVNQATSFQPGGSIGAFPVSTGFHIMFCILPSAIVISIPVNIANESGAVAVPSCIVRSKPVTSIKVLASKTAVPRFAVKPIPVTETFASAVTVGAFSCIVIS
jgi:hypothetical protein